MAEFVEVPKEELECLRRHLSEATRLLQGLRVREPEAPRLSAKKNRVDKYMQKLNNPKS